MLTISLALAALILPGQAPAAAPVAAAPARQVTGLSIFPPDIQVSTKRGKQVVVVQASYSDGITEDVSTKCNLRLENPALGRIDGQTILPVADGNSRVLANFGGVAAAAPLAMTQATAERPISFKLDVMPIFMRSGCNTGGCHGAAGLAPRGDRNSAERTGRTRHRLRLTQHHWLHSAVCPLRGKLVPS